MKQLLLLLAFSGCHHFCYSQSKISPTDIKKLSWLVGKWNNLSSEPGTTGYEKWEKLNQNEFKGSGITMKGSQIVFEEKLRILVKDGNIYYVADVSENNEPTYFKFTELTDNSFVCENPQHDFPKKISYKKNGNKIYASISGDGKSYDFVFEKQ